jgi:hypothetical protein
MIPHIKGDEIRLPQLFGNFERLAELNSSKGRKKNQPRVQHTHEKVPNIKINAYIFKYISSKTCELINTFPKIKDPMKCKKQHWLAASGSNSNV